MLKLLFREITSLIFHILRRILTMSDSNLSVFIRNCNLTLDLTLGQWRKSEKSSNFTKKKNGINKRSIKSINLSKLIRNA